MNTSYRHYIAPYIYKLILYLEPFFINNFAGVECAHSVDLHNRFEGIEGQSGGRAEEVSSSICQKQNDGF